MKVSRQGIIEIASDEGIVDMPYRDSKGIWTIRVGYTASAGPPDPSQKGCVQYRLQLRPKKEDLRLFWLRDGSKPPLQPLRRSSKLAASRCSSP
jgi:GH24 family phage-related lysozyme (muramidase)